MIEICDKGAHQFSFWLFIYRIGKRKDFHWLCFVLFLQIHEETEEGELLCLQAMNKDLSK